MYKCDSEKDIAIIGMSCRFPGASDYRKFWDNLLNGKTFSEKMRSDRWDIDELCDIKMKDGRDFSVIGWGNFIDDIDKFDHFFFGISDKEAMTMDPQQKIILELSWNCFEDACIRPSDLSGENIGVFVSEFGHDFKEMISQDFLSIQPHSLSGSSGCIIANRLSYQYNFRGPSLTIDTACSGGLTAIDEACKSIFYGESKLALVAGISVLTSPLTFMSMTQMKMLSPTGSCKTFDDSADGYVRGEGAGVLLLKPLKDALRDGNFIHGVIKGTASNHGGRVRSLTRPNDEAQADLIVHAVKNSNVPPETINYIETHGTGTPKGDPIEFEGLKKAYEVLLGKDQRENEHKIGLGSAKSNIGHLEAAAGLAGIIKVILSMENKKLPLLARYKKLNHRVSLEKTPFYIVDKNENWEQIKIDGKVIPRRAGVSSFGFGGSNSHTILEEAPDNNVDYLTLSKKEGYHLIVISAKSQSSLKCYLNELLDYLKSENNNINIEDIEQSLIKGREQFEYKICIICDTIDDLIKALEKNVTASNIVVNVNDQLNVEDDISYYDLDTIDNFSKDNDDISSDEYLKLLESIAHYLINEEKIDLLKLIPLSGRNIPLPGYCFDKIKFDIPYFNLAKNKICMPINQLLHSNCSTLKQHCYRSVFNVNDSVLSCVKKENTNIISIALLCAMADSAVKNAVGINERISLNNITVNVELQEKISVHKLMTTVEENDRKIIVAIIDEKSDKEIANFEYIEDSNDFESEIFDEKIDWDKSEDFEKYINKNGIYSNRDNIEANYVIVDENKLIVKYSIYNRQSELNNINIIDYLLGGIALNNAGEGTKIHFDKISFNKESVLCGTACISLSGDNVCTDINIYDMNGTNIISINGIKIESTYDILSDNFKNKLFKFIWRPIQTTIYEFDKNSCILVVSNSEKTIKYAQNNYYSVLAVSHAELQANTDSLVSLIIDNHISNILWECDEEKAKDYDQIIKKQDSGIYLIYGFVKKLLSVNMIKNKLNFTVITHNTQAVDDSEITYSDDAGLCGLMGVVSKEYRNWNITVLDVENSEQISKECFSYIKSERLGKDYALRNGIIYGRYIYETEVNYEAHAYKKEGVYVIVGGAGGIGQVLTKYILNKYKSNIVWLGRSDREKVEKKIAQCNIDGKCPDYFSADVTSIISLQNAYDEIIKKYGKINGVVHSAIGILDKSIQNMSSDVYKEIVSVKLEGAINVTKVFGKTALDFLVFFSSVSSAQRLAGQCGYVTGSNFLDLFAYYLNKCKGIRAKSINWGYWGNVGIGKSMPETAIRKIELSGMGNIQPYHAMQAMESVIDSDEIEYLYSPVDEEPFKEAFDVIDNIDSQAKEKIYVNLKNIFSNITMLPLNIISETDSFDKYGINEVTICEFLDAASSMYRCLSREMVHELFSIEEVAEFILKNDKCDVIEADNLVNEFDEEELDMDKISLIKNNTVQYLKNLIAEETGISINRIKSNTLTEKYGLDSIMIIHLTDIIKENVEDFDGTVFFKCTTVDKIADYMVEKYINSLKKLFNVEDTAIKKSVDKVEKDIDKPEKENNNFAKEYNSPNEVKSFVSNYAVKNSFPSVNLQHQNEVSSDIAIVGMSGKFPEADNISQFWDNLRQGKDCITEIPNDRWNIDDFYIPDKNTAIEKNKSYSKWGGMLKNFAAFDSLFFGISPKEAMSMDPQERLLLEETYKAFQDAGYTRERIAKKYNGNVGVFTGVTRTGYEWYGSELRNNGVNLRPNTSFSSIANRVSYFFNLNGPSLGIDTMCSSSLVALHVACQSILAGDCKMAIAGGANIYTHPSTYEYLCQLKMLSPTGRCHTFGINADGFVPGEGVDVLLIKRLEDAVRDHDNIYAVIKATSVNHDGKTNGFTVPSPIAQRNLVELTLKKAGISADKVSYIEAHGTGTMLGDPIEISALTEAFRKDTENKQFCAIGSVKTNIGHLEGAAGIAGVIKTILQMKYKKIVPHLHAEVLNPRINLSNSPFYVPNEIQEWKRPVIIENGVSKECKRIAGVSGFGAGGTNAHAILEEYDPDFSL